MTTTKLGRQILGHSYQCDCQSCQDCEPSWVSIEFEGDPDDCAFLDSAHCPRTINPGSPSIFAAVVVTVAAGGLLAMGVAVVLLNWLGVL